ncbi:MAG: type II toxin-antitoxin system RelE/ParE family toxin [Woeseiaceae bacterium]|nr:type II toxin-antitoxin system RelE/ParE family toxin [Woeseiaceae bacterium]
MLEEAENGGMSDRTPQEVWAAAAARHRSGMPSVSRLLRAAEGYDLDTIADYTVRRYGDQQAATYRDGLLQSFEAIARNPDIGSDQGHIKAAVRRYVHQLHTIYYRTARQEIIIMRILGPGQDPLYQLLDR